MQISYNSLSAFESFLSYCELDCAVCIQVVLLLTVGKEMRSQLQDRGSYTAHQSTLDYVAKPIPHTYSGGSSVPEMEVSLRNRQYRMWSTKVERVSGCRDKLY